MSDLKNLPNSDSKKISEEQARKFNYKYFCPLLVFHGEDGAEIKQQNDLFILKSDWEIIKSQIDFFYKKLTDKKIKEINEQMSKEQDELIERWNSSPRSKPQPKKGSIYIIQLKGKPIYKIGISSNPRERLKSVQCPIPLECILIHTISSNDIRSDEKKLHNLFDLKRISLTGFKRQEWFKLNKRDVRYLMNLNST